MTKLQEHLELLDDTQFLKFTNERVPEVIDLETLLYIKNRLDKIRSNDGV